MTQMRTLTLALVGTALIAGSPTVLADHKKKKKSGTYVSAPYTKVDVDDTVRVKAPYTSVKVRKGRVKVRAPYVNLDIKW